MNNSTFGVRFRRVPLRVPVRVVEPSGRQAEGRTENIGEGGLALRYSVHPPAIDSPVRVRLRLPHQTEEAEYSARVAWSLRQDDETHLGVRWELDQPSYVALHQFLGTFRYRVAVLGANEVSAALLTEALAGTLSPVFVRGGRDLEVLVQEGDVALVVMASPSSGIEVELVLRATQGSPPQPVLAFIDRDDQRFFDLLSREPRLVCAAPVEHAARLRGLLMTLVDGYTLAVDVERMGIETLALQRRVQGDSKRALDALKPSTRMPGLLGESPRMQSLFDQIHRVAGVDSAVVLQGETGTGKGVVARAIHLESPRGRRPFLVQNCAALSESLLDSELFGHMKGAFTGAISDRAGLFESAHTGTVFLDEVGDMSPGMQAKLLNVLQDGEIRRVGSPFATKVDVRIICASHKDLSALVKTGRFREDLYFRLVSFVVRIPPLRERRSDVPILAAHFLSQFVTRNRLPFRRFSPEAIAFLEQCEWPGNVRQLQHCIERTVLMSSDSVLGVADVERALETHADSSGSAGAVRLKSAMVQREREVVEGALERSGWVVADAAREMGVERSTLSRRIKRLGLKKPE